MKLIRVLMLIACLSSAVQSPIPAYGAEPIKLGVLASPSKRQALAQWQPLAGILKQAMPEHDFVVVALSHPELDQAVAARQLDFVLTDAGHYLLLRNRNGLSSPLATLASNGTGQSLTVYGGVIFSRAEQADINMLSDIKGKTVAAVATESQTAYQMQAYELSRVGIRLPQDVKLITTGFPQDQVVEAVLAGRADVGFVRSGVLEGMVREGKLDIKQLKIINRQDLPDFPLQVSTRLYPEWPFAAMPHIDENLARGVAVTLFELENSTAVTRAMGIYGFVVPADYSPVEDVLRELRMPPFEVAPSFTLQDVWTHYYWQTMGALLAGGVILFLGVNLLLMYRRLAAKRLLLLQQQQKLQELEEFRSRVFDSSVLPIVVMDAVTFKFVDCNPAAVNIYRFPSREEVLGKTPTDVSAPVQYDGTPSPEKARFYIEKSMAEEAVAFEWLHQRPNGEFWDAEVQLMSFYVGQHQFLQFTLQDVTERRQTAQALAESEHRFKAILDATVDGILVADAQSHTFVMANNAICDMLGYPMEELTLLGIKDIHPAEAFPEVQRQFGRQMKGEIRVAPDLPVQRKDGSIFFADVSTAPIVLAGRLLLVGVFHDVTERKQAEEKISKLNSELEEKVVERTRQLLAAQEVLVRKEKLALLGQIAGSVGHELRNPLGVMNNAVYFLQTVLTDADETTREYLKIIKDEIADAERIVSDLLDAVRIKPPQPKAVEVHEVIGQTLGKLTIPPSVSVKLDIPESLPALRVDVMQIQQVFRNLISNAVEAMPEGGVLEISAVENRQDDGAVTVSVRDSGRGITPEVLAKLFQPLFTTKASGIGLGLVVVKNLTQSNGGTIRVESAIGQGTTFTVVLPTINSSLKVS